MANSAIFLSTPSARRATAQLAALTAELEDFYPRPPRGGRPSTPPPWSSVAHFYPRPPRGGRPALPGDLLVLFFISIHALREEGDGGTPGARLCAAHFYPRPPRGGRLPFMPIPQQRESISIHALREEGDCIDRLMGHKSKDFYPRPPRGGRHLPSGWFPDLRYFYPRPPRGGRRGPLLKPSESRADFYPRPPRGGRPKGGHCTAVAQLISIHALREEGDSGSCTIGGRGFDFYPRPPRGGRPLKTRTGFRNERFLSTPSARRATWTVGTTETTTKFLSTPSARRATL